MRLFGTAVLAVVALAASQSAAQNYEQAIQFTRAKPQDESLRGRNLGRNKKKRKHRHHHEEETQTEGTQIPDDEYEKETRQGNPSCSVCGDGMQVGNPDASVSFPGQSGQIPCGVLENMGIVGLIPEPQCEVLPQLIDSICECQSIVSTSTLPTASVVTTTEATKKPGPGSGSAKAGKSAQLSHSMSIPAKAGKSFSGKSPTTKSSGKSNKTVTTKSTSKGSKMIASKASSKAEKSAGKSSKSSSTFDAKAEKVTGSSKGAKAASTSESTTAATELATTELATTESTAAASASADDPPFLPPTPLPPDDAPPPSVPTQPVEETVTVEETTTLELVFTGDGDPPSPLLECQGDCDDDSQCEGTLQCFQRAGDEPVPGCSGEAKTGSDYCARRPTANTVWLKGDDRKPPENFPLGLCEGDCDNDDHCQDGLVCQQRNGDEPIPGCIGDPIKGIDYCRYPDP